MKPFTKTGNLISKLLVPIFLLISVLTAKLYGQGTISDEDMYQGEINRMTQIPTSPEASAFTKYGDTKVSLYTGTPQIGVPLYTYQGREYNLDFALSYDASGVKVEQSAGAVGLSWSLQPGGRITRQTNGLPDDFTVGTYETLFNSAGVRDSMDIYLAVPGVFSDNPRFASISQAQNFLYFMYDINLNQIDAQRDVFKVNAGNLNDTFVFDFVNGQHVPKSLSNPRLKIEPTIYAGSYVQSWKVTDEDGTEYYFDAEELTYRENNDVDAGDPMGDASVTYISSWLLTKIISPNEKDTYEFFYKNEDYGPFEQFATSSGNNITDIQAGQTYYYYYSGTGSTSAVRSNNRPLYLTQVKHNGNTIATLGYGGRYDFDASVSNSRLTSINIQDRLANPIRSVIFHNDNYFNRDGQTLTQLANHTTKEYYDIRLKLDSVEVKGAHGQLSQMFSFEYQSPDDLPSRFSYAQDYFGYYNGSNSNSTLIPHLETSGLTFEGGDREPDSASGRVGLLTKISYPTGGYTEFEYEPHTIYTIEESNTTLTPLQLSLNASSTTDPDLYRDDEGLLCDDEFETRGPKIVIQKFFAPQTGNYNVNLIGNPSEVDAYIVDVSLGTENYSNYCEFYNDPNALWIENSPSSTIYLETGKMYRALLLLAKDNTNQYNSAYLSVTKDTVTYTPINKNMGGNRIANISDYSKQGMLAGKKQYGYGDTESTGILNYQPYVYETRAADTETEPVEQVVRYGTFATGDEPHVVYSKVTESQVNGSGVELGRTEYSFFEGTKGSVPMTTPPYENNFFPDLRPGQLHKKEVLDENLQVLERDSTNYFETVVRPVNVTSIAVRTDPDRYEKLVFLKEEKGPDGIQNTSDDYVALVYLPAFVCNAPNTPSGYCMPPSYISDPVGSGYHSFMAKKYAPFSIRKAFANGAYGGVNYVRSEKLFGSGSLEKLVSEEITEYDDYSTGTKYLPASKITTNSMGQTIKTEYSYPHQGSLAGDLLLVNKNNLVEVTRTVETLEPGTVDEEKLREFSKTYGLFGSAVLPSEMKLAKADESEDVMYDLDFYAGGNIKEVHRPDGPSTFYIWGYGDTYPIAKIDNMEAGDITATIQTYIDAAVASSDLDDDRCHTTGCAEQELLDDLQVLRNNLPPNVLMTTYTYDPQIGVTTITDTKGYTTFFEYDGLGRLVNTKDEDLNLLNEYQYHFKGQN